MLSLHSTDKFHAPVLRDIKSIRIESSTVHFRRPRFAPGFFFVHHFADRHVPFMFSHKITELCLIPCYYFTSILTKSNPPCSRFYISRKIGVLTGEQLETLLNEYYVNVFQHHYIAIHFNKTWLFPFHFFY